MIKIFGEIGLDVTAEDVVSQIEAEEGDSIDVVISSGGGNAFEGLAIYEALKASDKEINTSILGLAASAASIIFMAGDNREMSIGSLLMIHNSWTVAAGNSAELEKTQGTLDAIDSRMVAIYAEGTGLESDVINELLLADTFMSAEEAHEQGFATVIQAAEVAAKLAVMNVNTKKEDTNMSEVKEPVEQEEVDKGLFAKFKAWMASEPKADEHDPEEDERRRKEEEEQEAKAKRKAKKKRRKRKATMLKH